MPKHVNRIRGRDGVNRYYYRRPGRENVRLPDLTSPDFAAAYAAAEVDAEPIVIGASRSKAGSVAATVGAYLASAEFAGLADETRRTRRNIMERFREAHGDKSATPSAARNLLAVIRILMLAAIKAGFRADDPTLGVKHAKASEPGRRRRSTPLRPHMESAVVPGSPSCSCFTPVSAAATW
jgi:hypothetical protein